MVLTPNQLNTEQSLLDITTKRDALTYLHSLQLMVLLSYPVAAYTAPHFSKDGLKALAAQSSHRMGFLFRILPAGSRCNRTTQ